MNDLIILLEISCWYKEQDYLFLGRSVQRKGFNVDCLLFLLNAHGSDFGFQMQVNLSFIFSEKRVCK